MGLTWKRKGLGYLGMEASHFLNSVLNVGEYALLKPYGDKRAPMMRALVMCVR